MNRGMWGKKLELAVRTLCIRPRQSEVLRKLAEASLVGGGHTRMKKQHGRGKLSARERLSLLYDRGEFIESDQLVSSPSGTPGDGVVTARGKVFGREVIAFSQDFTVSGGTLSAANAKKICKAMDKALELACPIVGINDSGGARIQEGVASLAGYTEVFKRNVQMSGVVPQISLVMGPCAGGAVYSPALTDFIVMVRGTSHMFVTGPDVIKEVLHETVTMEALGGARTHTNRSGVAHLASENDVDAIASVRELLSFLPSFWQEKSPIHPISAAQSETDLDPALDTIVPTDPNQPYDMSEVAERILDRGNLFQVHEDWAKNMITGFGRVGGQTVGVVANQPKELAGVLDIDASIKAARFVRFCDAFSIPILTLVDVPGFLPGTAQEWNGIIRHGAKLLYAFAEATTPKVTVITRKAYGGAYCVMSSKHLRGDFNYAWPTGEVAVMGAKGAVQILHSHLSKSELLEHQREYELKFSNPVEAARRGYIDAVITPRTTRAAIARDLRMLQRKDPSRLFNPTPQKKHGSIPL